MLWKSTIKMVKKSTYSIIFLRYIVGGSDSSLCSPARDETLTLLVGPILVLGYGSSNWSSGLRMRGLTLEVHQRTSVGRTFFSLRTRARSRPWREKNVQLYFGLFQIRASVVGSFSFGEQLVEAHHRRDIGRGGVVAT